MSKEEFLKEYQKIILKTNGGNDDYVVAICQASDLITRFANEKEQQISDLQSQLAEKDKEIEKLEEQLKNTIVPKFKVGDKVYGIIDTWAYTDVFPVEIRDTHLLYEVWDGEDTTKQHSTRIFATKEEAEQKLNELKGDVE